VQVLLAKVMLVVMVFRLAHILLEAVVVLELLVVMQPLEIFLVTVALV
jgi:hypothetical protein